MMFDALTCLELDIFSDTLLRAAIACLLIGITLFVMNRVFKKGADVRSETLQQKFKVMTKELIDQTADCDLVEAVVANLLAKQDKQNPQPYGMLASLSRGRGAVYSIWLITCELRENGFDRLYGGPSALFCETAIDGFVMLGAERCATALREGEGLTDARALAEAIDTYRAAVTAEDPLGRCITYIRENPSEFTDDNTPSETEDASSETDA